MNGKVVSCVGGVGRRVRKVLESTYLGRSACVDLFPTDPPCT